MVVRMVMACGGVYNFTMPLGEERREKREERREKREGDEERRR